MKAWQYRFTSEKFISLNMNNKDNNTTNEDITRKNILRESEEASGIKVEGYNFDSGVDWKKIIANYSSIGFQATQLSKAIDIIKKMRKEKAFIYLGYTSNLVSSGLRDMFRFLAKHNQVNLIVTTAGGVEEDIIKCLGDFKIGDFNAQGKELREKGINRIGNVFVPNSRYCRFEEFILPILEELAQEQEKTGKIITPSQLIWKLGEKINNEESIYYWCFKNKIPVFCPAITDGSLGDMIYFFKFKHPEFKIDVSDDIVGMNNSSVGKKKTGIIILGSGIIKHHICNANMFRNGADYAVYINTEQEYNGSDSGAKPDEAVSWGKIAENAESVKVYCDATLVFPLIMAECFAEN